LRITNQKHKCTKHTLSNPAMFLFSAKNSAGDSTN